MAEDTTNDVDLPSDFSACVSRALQASFRHAAERAKQTNTYLVVMQNDEIVKIPPHEIDAFVTQSLL